MATAALCSVRGPEAAQPAGPFEDAPVRSDQAVALQGRGDYEPVGWVAVHVLQKARAGGDSAIDWDLDESLVQQSVSPSIQIEVETKPALLQLHTDFPEGYC
jgi:hypothetical protein